MSATHPVDLAQHPRQGKTDHAEVGKTLQSGADVSLCRYDCESLRAVFPRIIRI